MSQPNSLLLVCVVFVGYIIAYRTYGRFLAGRIFRLDDQAVCPSEQLRDNIDYVPTRKHILFGHHFTSIAGLGPIVGPAIGVIWGWLPAMLWVFFGSILMGAAHDFGALVLSLRHQGRSIGDLASETVNPRVRLLFLIIIFFTLWIVISIFALIIALLFNMYPAAVIPVWFEIPIALCLGWWVYKKGGGAFWPSIIAVTIMYATVMIGAYVPIDVKGYLASAGVADAGQLAIVFWIVMVLVFNSWLASTLPVQTLLQPRDFINSHQLMIAMALLLLGVIVAHPPIVAPMVNADPVGAPPLWPFLFVTIACGAISGFHSLVSSGTSAKQCRSERDSLFIGYGSMLWEGALATLVIVAVAAGIGMGIQANDAQLLTGSEAFSHHYASWAAAQGLNAKLGAFVLGATNMITTVGIPEKIALAIMAVFIVSFAGTTVDSATRIQRYVVIELGRATKVRPLQNRQIATLIAVVTAAALAFADGSGKGALKLWPLFGGLNQLLAGLALLVITIYLARRRQPTIYTAVPMLLMIFMTGWAMLSKVRTFYNTGDTLLLAISAIVFILEIWMIIECVIVFNRVRSTRKTQPPPAAPES